MGDIYREGRYSQAPRGCTLRCSMQAQTHPSAVRFPPPACHPPDALCPSSGKGKSIFPSHWPTAAITRREAIPKGLQLPCQNVLSTCNGGRQGARPRHSPSGHIFGPEMPCGHAPSQDGTGCVHPTSTFPVTVQEEGDNGSYWG